jgi:hypothetical protein
MPADVIVGPIHANLQEGLIAFLYLIRLGPIQDEKTEGHA